MYKFDNVYELNFPTARLDRIPIGSMVEKVSAVFKKSKPNFIFTNLLKLRNIYYNEIALSNRNGVANYNYNRFFESAGSSLSNVIVGT